jgi:hypothetical protein
MNDRGKRVDAEIGLTGTKLGCGEGGCGACTVMLSTTEGDKLLHRSVNACLCPLYAVEGAHVVTVEGVVTHNLLSPAPSLAFGLSVCLSVCVCVEGGGGYGCECAGPCVRACMGGCRVDVCGGLGGGGLWMMGWLFQSYPRVLGQHSAKRGREAMHSAGERARGVICVETAVFA